MAVLNLIVTKEGEPEDEEENPLQIRPGAEILLILVATEMPLVPATENYFSAKGTGRSAASGLTNHMVCCDLLWDPDPANEQL